MARQHYLTLLLLIVAGFAGGCAKSVPATSAPRPVVVEAPRALRDVTDGDALPGSIHARVEANLSFRVPGKVAERRVDMGAHVERGTVLAILDPQDARLNLEAARAGVAAAKADLMLARAEESRYRDLRARGFAGQSQLDVHVNAAHLAGARLEQAQAQFDLATNQSRYTHLTADAAGVVTEIMAEPGNVVVAGQPIVRFAADGEREAHVNIPEGRLESLRDAPDIAVEIYSNPGKHYRGQVRDINPQADAATRTHRARITIIDADEAVRLGATATVLLRDTAGGQSFLLPATALGAIDRDRPAVWRLLEGPQGTTVEPVAVEVLRYLDGAVAVNGPLSTSDRLVSAGVHRLTAGMAVQVIERSAKAAL